MTKFAWLGSTGSLTNSFNPSAIGWKNPKNPTTLGPFLLCIAAIILRSANVKKATPNNKGMVIANILITMISKYINFFFIFDKMPIFLLKLHLNFNDTIELFLRK